MSVNCSIQYVDSSCNPSAGCSGCELWNKNRKTCYAGVLHRRYPNHKGFAPTFEEVTKFPGRMEKATRWSDLTGKNRLDKPWLNGLPRLIFVSDMSDALSAEIDFDYLYEEIILNVRSEAGKRHQWLWLTKRPERMAEFSCWLDDKKGMRWAKNLWVGTSITTQNTTSRIEPLLRVGDASTIHFLSVEPQWEFVELDQWLPNLSWVIQGGESGPQAKPFDISWANDMIIQCKHQKVPFFLKQMGRNVVCNGKRTKFAGGHADDWDEWTPDLRVREMPNLSNYIMSGHTTLKVVPTS